MTIAQMYTLLNRWRRKERMSNRRGLVFSLTFFSLVFLSSFPFHSGARFWMMSSNPEIWTGCGGCFRNLRQPHGHDNGVLRGIFCDAVTWRHRGHGRGSDADRNINWISTIQPLIWRSHEVGVMFTAESLSLLGIASIFSHAAGTTIH
jgi:hypothetical protein